METRSSFKMRPGSEKPREKLKLYGPSCLSESELLAIVLRTGSKDKSVLELCEGLLNAFGGLKGVFEASLEELEDFDGIGFAKACQIKAIDELVKRLNRSSFSPYVRLSNPSEVYTFLKGIFSWEREEVYVLLLNAKGGVLGVRKVAQGTLRESPVYPREVVSAAIKSNASRVILSHNHLSGDPTPSEEDLSITRKIGDLLCEMDIRLDDHIIIGKGKFYSFAAKAVLEEG